MTVIRMAQGLTWLGLILLLAGTNASATPIVSSLTGLVSPTSTLDFSEVEVPNDAELTNQFTMFDVTFSSLFYNGCVSCVIAPPDGIKPDIGNFNRGNTSVFNTSIAMDFSSPVTGAAFELAANYNTFIFSAFLRGGLVETFTVNINTSRINGVSGWGHYGFSNITFDRISVSANEALLIDNLEFVAIPRVHPRSNPRQAVSRASR
jgi:hypothetical protein